MREREQLKLKKKHSETVQRGNKRKSDGSEGCSSSKKQRPGKKGMLARVIYKNKIK